MREKKRCPDAEPFDDSLNADQNDPKKRSIENELKRVEIRGTKLGESGHERKAQGGCEHPETLHEKIRVTRTTNKAPPQTSLTAGHRKRMDSQTESIRMKRGLIRASVRGAA